MIETDKKGTSFVPPRLDPPRRLKAEPYEEPTIENVPETIVAAAVQLEGITFSLPKPARHGQVLHSMLDVVEHEASINYATQGFLTSEGRFVNRVQAKQIAHIAKQPIVRDNPHPKDAFSEDFW